MTGLGLGLAGREGRRGARPVGDHADQAAGLKAQAQLDAPAMEPAGGVSGGGSAVPYGVRGQF
jgi:hypothetical protein